MHYSAQEVVSDKFLYNRSGKATRTLTHSLIIGRFCILQCNLVLISPLLGMGK